MTDTNVTSPAKGEVLPLRPLTEATALEWLRRQPGGRTTLSGAELGRRWGWPRYNVSRRLQRWRKDGFVAQQGRFLVAVDIEPPEAATTGLQHVDAAPELVPQSDRSVAVRNAAQNAATVAAPPSHYIDRLMLDQRLVPALRAERRAATDIRPDGPVVARSAEIAPRRRGSADGLAYLAAIALATVAALFSVKGMTVLFPGAPVAIVTMATTMEAAKLITTGWLSRRWRSTAWVWRTVLIAFVAGLAVINGTGVYSQLVAAHVGETGAALASQETQAAELAARIEVASHAVADLDARVAQIDSAIAEATRRGRTNSALAAMEGQRRVRAGLTSEREQASGTLVALKIDRASLAAKGRQAETEAAPIRYVAELIGTDTDSERAIRWLIALMVLCCDPLAIALTAAASARKT